MADAFRLFDIRNVIILGGEATVDPDFWDKLRVITRVMEGKNTDHLILTTNGNRLGDPAFADKVAASRIDAVNLSRMHYDQAENDWKYACRGTRMNVKGSIRVRAVERKVCCPECGYMEDVTYRILEVVASGVGYTSDWNQPEKRENGPEIIVRDGMGEEE